MKLSHFNNQPNRHILKKPLIILFWLLAWQTASALVPSRIMVASPIDTLWALWGLCRGASFYLSVLNSLARIFAGFLTGLVLGVLFAFAGYVFPWVNDFLSPVLSALKAAPVASFIILALLWIQSRNLSVFISFTLVLPGVYAAARAGLNNIDPKLIEMGRLFRLSPVKRLRGIYAQSLMPYIIPSAATGLGFGWKSGIAAEVIGLPPDTIGIHLYQSKIYLEIPELFAWTFTVIFFSVIMEKTFLAAIGRIRKWV